uniref:Uncharacterized protein n=1 Tax=Amphimedon queenslandica TaxID=400682 RepID=A0A1X7UB87_AMPQE
MLVLLMKLVLFYCFFVLFFVATHNC